MRTSGGSQDDMGKAYLTSSGSATVSSRQEAVHQSSARSPKQLLHLLGTANLFTCRFDYRRNALLP